MFSLSQNGFQSPKPQHEVHHTPLKPHFTFAGSARSLVDELSTRMRRALRVLLACFNIFDTAFAWKTITQPGLESRRVVSGNNGQRRSGG